MKTVADPFVRSVLIARLSAVRADSTRRWGTLTPHEMLCHLGDATARVLGTRPRPEPIRVPAQPIVKCLALWTPVRWPHGWPTNPSHDPKRAGTRPSVFEMDRARAIAGIEDLAAASAGSLEPVHGVFGTMSVRDWQ